MSSAWPILDELGKKLEDRSRPAQERLEIILTFEEWAGAQVRPPLVAVLKDPSPAIRAAAARALGWPGNNEAVPALRERVETPGEAAGVRAAAVRSLGRIGDRSVRALVITATGAPDASVREAALWSVALGSLVDPADRTLYLMRLAEDRAAEAQLRTEAIRALASVKEEGVVDGLARILEGEPRLTIALPSGTPTDQQIMVLRYAQARDVAGWAAGALGLLEARTALPLLLKTAEDPNDYFLRLMSLQSLVGWNVPEAFPVLVRGLEDPLPDIRVLALTGLARLGDPKALDPVLARLSDASPAVRALAVPTLTLLGGPKVRPQLEAMQQKESDPDVRGALEDELSRLPR
ncbi:MAG TPA: HEAT repeat domain-containing protein [Methylomirabilota bacterium]|nr:HEAT repeat domain-containing protein [Methylomirabilota bacterium]